MFAFIKGAAAAASVVAAVTAGIVFALPGHAGLLGSASGSTVPASAPAHHWHHKHHRHHGHHGSGGTGSGAASGGPGPA